MTPAWSQARSPFTYGGWTANAVRRLKYHDEPDRAQHMARTMYPKIAEMGQFDALVPVPLHTKRLAERGYNQSALLADAISRATGIPVEHALLRTTNTSPQVKLSRDNRLENLKGAFNVNPDWQAESGNRYLLIDDVRTTGATLNECVITLVLAGTGPVSALTFALDIANTPAASKP
ncbi:MAG: ComF family protein [Thermomicrobiales bacterium]